MVALISTRFQTNLTMQRHEGKRCIHLSPLLKVKTRERHAKPCRKYARCFVTGWSKNKFLLAECRHCYWRGSNFKNESRQWLAIIEILTTTESGKVVCNTKNLNGPREYVPRVSSKFIILVSFEEDRHIRCDDRNELKSFLISVCIRFVFTAHTTFSYLYVKVHDMKFNIFAHTFFLATLYCRKIVRARCICRRKYFQVSVTLEPDTTLS